MSNEKDVGYHRLKQNGSCYYSRSSLADAMSLAVTFDDIPVFSDIVSASTDTSDSIVSNPAALSFSSVALPTPLSSPSSNVEASGLSDSVGSLAGDSD